MRVLVQDDAALYYARKIKKYCNDMKSCHDCIFAYDDKVSIIRDNCALNNPNPSDWKLEEVDKCRK